MDQYIANTTIQRKIAHLGITDCRNICRKYGTKYYLATLFLPVADKQATWVVYSFLRIVDEVVDTENIKHSEASEKVSWIQKRFNGFYSSETFSDSYEYDYVLKLTADVFKNYKIPLTYAESFFSAMQADTQVSSYQTYSELQNYMYGSAGVVGLMMAQIVGYDQKASPQAILLGEAMQMTNFLRDIGEDLLERNRIYLPQDTLLQYKITPLLLKNYAKTGMVDSEFASFMKSEISKNRSQYKSANPGIMYLSPKARLGVYLASRLYEKTLEKIEQNQYNVFNMRAKVTALEKITVITQSLWNLYLKKSL